MYPGKGCIKLLPSVKTRLGSYITAMKSFCKVAIILLDKINHFLKLRISLIAMVDFSIIILFVKTRVNCLSNYTLAKDVFSFQHQLRLWLEVISQLWRVFVKSQFSFGQDQSFSKTENIFDHHGWLFNHNFVC